MSRSIAALFLLCFLLCPPDVDEVEGVGVEAGVCAVQVRAGGTTPATPAMAGVKFRQLRLVPRLEFPPGTSLCAPRALLREKWQAVPAPAVAYLSLAIILINLHHPSSFRNESLAMPSLVSEVAVATL